MEWRYRADCLVPVKIPFITLVPPWEGMGFLRDAQELSLGIRLTDSFLGDVSALLTTPAPHSILIEGEQMETVKCFLVFHSIAVSCLGWGLGLSADSLGQKKKKKKGSS